MVHKSNYTFCNQLGAEAKVLEIDGLVTGSARYKGSNLPVFTRSAVSDPELGGVVAMTYDPSTGNVSVRLVDEQVEWIFR